MLAFNGTVFLFDDHIIPTLHLYENVDRKFGESYWFWFFYTVPAPVPETFINQSSDLQDFIVEALATRITARNGGGITVHAASEKSIRGQHPRGPSGAGGIVLDEASLIEDRIIDAAKLRRGFSSITTTIASSSAPWALP